MNVRPRLALFACLAGGISFVGVSRAVLSHRSLMMHISAGGMAFLNRLGSPSSALRESRTYWNAISGSLFSDTSSADGSVPSNGIGSAGAAQASYAIGSPADPLADYVYTGTVNQGGELSALIERRATKQGWYVAAGESWQGYRVLNVTEQAVTLLVNGSRRALPKNDDINLVPLLASADEGGTGGDSQSASSALIASLLTDETHAWDIDLDAPANGVDVEKIKDDAFDRKISVEDEDRLLSQNANSAGGIPSIYTDRVIVNYSADVSGAIEMDTQIVAQQAAETYQQAVIQTEASQPTESINWTIDQEESPRFTAPMDPVDSDSDTEQL